MSKLSSIRLAIELATRERDQFAKNHAHALGSVDFARGQLSQLVSYASDIDHRWVGVGAGALSAEMVRHHYQFMDRLQTAIALQEEVVANFLRQADLAHKTLLKAEVKLSGLGQLLKAREAMQDMAQRRREQAETDEFASQRFLRARADNALGELR
jgi:flagellar FliJ protein